VINENLKNLIINICSRFDQDKFINCLNDLQINKDLLPSLTELSKVTADKSSDLPKVTADKFSDFPVIEKKSNIKIIIIGAGPVGLLTAILLRKKNKSTDVIVIDNKVLPGTFSKTPYDRLQIMRVTPLIKNNARYTTHKKIY
jgi:hypothetical protein